MEAILQISAVVFYFLATLHYLLYLVFKNKTIIAKIATVFTSVGFISHTVVIGVYRCHSGRLPITSRADIVSLFGWAMILAYLIAEWKHGHKIWVFGSFVLPLAFAAGMYTSFLPHKMEIFPSGTKTVFLTFHVSSASIGFASFGFAFCLAIMYLLQERQLKSRHPGSLFFRLPSLDTLDKLSYRCISVGFPIITLSTILGILWIWSTRDSVFSWKPVEIWWLMIWFFYAILLQARFTIGWRGRKASYLTIFIFLLSCVPLLT